MEAYKTFKEEEDIYTFCIERRRKSFELTIKMIEDGRMEELRAAAEDPDLQQKLPAEYQL